MLRALSRLPSRPETHLLPARPCPSVSTICRGGRGGGGGRGRARGTPAASAAAGSAAAGGGGRGRGKKGSKKMLHHEKSALRKEMEQEVGAASCWPAGVRAAPTWLPCLTRSIAVLEAFLGLLKGLLKRVAWQAYGGACAAGCEQECTLLTSQPASQPPD